MYAFAVTCQCSTCIAEDDEFTGTMYSFPAARTLDLTVLSYYIVKVILFQSIPVYSSKSN